MRQRLAPVLLVLLLAPICAGREAVAQDIENGRQLFERCLACHDSGGPGPSLAGIVGQKMGAVQGFTYSQALQDANAKDLTWTEDALSQFLAAPQTFLPKNKMAFGAVTDNADRRDLIAYLKTLR